MNSSNTSSSFESLLNYLKQSHGIDFTGYQRASLTRRVHHRMQEIQIERESDYIKHLKAHPEEATFLLNTILINFTGFFRDTLTWEYLTTEIVPKIIAGKRPDEPIRVWSAGCASGEETYTLAIVLVEALGWEQFRSRVQIYGTDRDEAALHQAHLGSYSSSNVVGIPADLLNQYFERVEQRYVFRTNLLHNDKQRRSIWFFRHDLITDAPLSRIDLLLCRNVLMYFNFETQIRALVRFHFGLADNGFLCLGNVEMIPTPIFSIFHQENWQHRIFTKLPRANLSQYWFVKSVTRR